MFSSSILLELELELAVLLEELCLRRLWTETESKLVLVFLSLIERNPDDPFWSTPLFSWCIRNCSRPCCSTNHEIRPSSSRLLLLLLRGAGEIFQCEEDGMAWLGLKSSLTHMSYARHNVHTHEEQQQQQRSWISPTCPHSTLRRFGQETSEGSKLFYHWNSWHSWSELQGFEYTFSTPANNVWIEVMKVIGLLLILSMSDIWYSFDFL